jgi:hypothetical protein
VLGLMLVIVGVRQVGDRSPDRLALIWGDGHTAFPQVCWYAICAGRTSKQTSIAKLTDVAKANAAQIIHNPVLVDGGFLITYDACTTVMPPAWSACIRPDEGETIAVQIKLTKLGRCHHTFGHPRKCTFMHRISTKPWRYTIGRHTDIFALQKWDFGVSVQAIEV